MKLDTIREKLPEIWEFLRDYQDLTDVSFRTWFEPLQVFSFEDDTLTLLFPENIPNAAVYIMNKYGPYMQASVKVITGIECQIQIITPEAAAKKSVPEKKEKTDLNPARFNLNPRYTFDTFVVGGNNKLAHAASLAVAEAPAEVYNPLFIYGGSGLGKTHLMHSIAHFILKRNPDAKVTYVTSEKFTSELIDAIRRNTTPDFQAKYRSSDVLLIDDIQFIAKKESTQEEVFHTFNTLYDAKKQIILSSDRPPKDIETLDDRLRSRFQWGLTADIGLPDYETRMAILRKKEEMDGFNIDNAIIQYIAANIVSNIRDLEGALNKITSLSKLNGGQSEITLELAKEALKDQISPNARKELTPEYIIDIVADHYHVKPTDLASEGRGRKLTTPRHISMYLIRKMTNLPYKQIAELFNRGDHTTVMNAEKKIRGEMETDESLRNTLDILQKKINPE